MGVLLDGNEVEVGQIDPKKHKFVGMFRFPYVFPTAYVACGCGSVLQAMDETYDHWLRGHFDVAQYETIEKPEVEWKQSFCGMKDDKVFDNKNLAEEDYLFENYREIKKYGEG